MSVKLMLAIYCLLAITATWLLWRNIAAPDAMKNAAIVVASILPVLVSVLPYLNRENFEQYFNFTLLFDSKTQKIISGERWSPYSSAYMHMFTNVHLVEDSLSAKDFGTLMGNPGLDLIEKGILETLMLSFGQHWDVKQTQFVGPGFTGRELAFSSDPNKSVLNIESLQAVFKHNRLITHPGVIVQPTLVLPPKSKIVVEVSDRQRSIGLRNPVLDIDILISSASGGVLQQGIWGVQRADPADMNRYCGVNYKLTLRGTIHRTKTYADETEKYLPIPLMSPICSGHVARLRKRVSAGFGDCTVSGRHPSRLISFCA